MRLRGFTGLVALLGSVLTASDAIAQRADTSSIRGAYAGTEGRRAYRLFLPAGHRRAAPLVVLLHGCTQDPDALAMGTRFDTHAAAAGAVVLYPEQPVDANPRTCWNWFDPAHQSRDGGEPALLAGMTREVASRHKVDPARIYIGGLSAGGAMAVLTGLAYPDLFAAIGAHSGVGWRAAHDLPSALAAMRGSTIDVDSLARLAREGMGGSVRAVPLIALHGMADSIVRPSATEQMVEHFVALAGLARPEGSPMRIDSVRGASGGYEYLVRRVRNAEGSVIIEEWLIQGLGHAWSGGSPNVQWMDQRGPDATEEMLRFFLQQRLGQESGHGQAGR